MISYYLFGVSALYFNPSLAYNICNIFHRLNNINCWHIPRKNCFVYHSEIILMHTFLFIFSVHCLRNVWPCFLNMDIRGDSKVPRKSEQFLARRHIEFFRYFFVCSFPHVSRGGGNNDSIVGLARGDSQFYCVYGWICACSSAALSWDSARARHQRGATSKRFYLHQHSRMYAEYEIFIRMWCNIMTCRAQQMGGAKRYLTQYWELCAIGTIKMRI